MLDSNYIIQTKNKIEKTKDARESFGENNWRTLNIDDFSAFQIREIVRSIIKINYFGAWEKNLCIIFIHSSSYFYISLLDLPKKKDYISLSIKI